MAETTTGVHIDAEVQYLAHVKDGRYETVHSDICVTCREDGTFSKVDRDFLHANLDEWLDKGWGTGFFYVGNIQDAVE